MSFAALVLCLILSIIGAITTLILSIIFLATSKSKNALISSVFFIMMLASGILCITEIATRVKDGVHELSDKFREGADSLESKIKQWGDSVSVKYDRDKSAFHDTLESYVPPNVKDTLGKKFWQHERGAYSIMPLTYPYQLEADESLDEGARIICYAKNGCRLDQVSIVPENITRLNLDRNFILFKKDNTVTGRNKELNEPDILYVLFDVRTGSTRSFINENTLLREALKAGYTGESQLMDLEDYYDRL